MPSIPVQRTGTTGALPLSADEDKIRINTSRVSSRDAVAETMSMDERRNAELRAARNAGRWGRRIAWLVVLALVGAGGYFAYDHYLGPKPALTTPVATPPPVTTPAAKVPDKGKVKTPPAAKDDDKMSPAEIDRMLEWARRTAEGGRILAPPGDNLKELLDRIDKADPGNAQAEALKQKTTTMLGRKGTLALKKGRLDEAAEDFEALVGLKPDDEWSKGRLARALTLRAQRSLGKNKFQAALADATAALEYAPEDTNIQLTLGDVHLQMGKRELAAEEYQRVLDVKPQDVRAKLGLQRATAAKKPPPKKKKGR
jgi:tetratricopeptide (TPR) repeat protein